MLEQIINRLHRGCRKSVHAFLAVLLIHVLPGAVAGTEAAVDQDRVDVDLPSVVLSNIPYDIGLRAIEEAAPELAGTTLTLTIDGRSFELTLDEAGEARVERVVFPRGLVQVQVEIDGEQMGRAVARAIPAWLSIVPALLAIGMALVFRQVVAALFLGVWVGGWIAYGLAPAGLWFGLLDTLQVYVLSALTNPDYASIIVFSFMIGGTVGIISRNGGMMGIVNIVTRWARSPRRGQVATGVLGVSIFFDDYANTLVVGNTMRAITDRLRISREKLAYLVDSTAAPIACIALVTTWIGFQVGLIGEAIQQIPGFDEGAYSVFLNSIPYSFYPVLAIVFVFMVAASGRDFGSMYKAEARARSTGQLFRPNANVADEGAGGGELEPHSDKPMRAINAVIPVAILVFGTMIGLYVTGEGETLREIIGDADPFRAMLWASLLSVVAAIILSVAQRIISLQEALEAWYTGVKTMVLAIIILILAWALADVNDEINTAGFLVSILGERLNPGLVPALVFLLAAFTSFATGTSWGTMGILMPLVLPLAWAVMAADGLHTEAEYYHIIYSSTSAVLAGSVWGDHCSPIADTTILSSLASGCDHIDHVRTQLPYALLVGAVALIVGTLPTGFGFPWWLSMTAGIAILGAVLIRFGKKS